MDEAEEKNQFKENILSTEKLDESLGAWGWGWRAPWTGSLEAGFLIQPHTPELCDSRWATSCL